MRIKLFSIVFASCLVAACKSPEPETHAASSLPALTTLPATIEGDLEITVSEGDVDENGDAEFNFGTLTVNGNEICVQMSGSILQSASLSNGKGKVSATLGSKEESAEDCYTVVALKKR